MRQPAGSESESCARNAVLPALPPASELFMLLEAYSSRLWVLAAVHHVPTFARRLLRLAETGQTLLDYSACSMCPHAVRAVMWAGFIALGKRHEAELWGDACRAGLLDWATRLELFDDPATTKAQPAELFDFIKAGVIALLPLYISGLAEEGSKLKQLLIVAHRLSRFGWDLSDRCRLPEKEGSKLASGAPRRRTVVTRDPLDLAEWISAEERTRASCQLLAFAQASAYLQGTTCSVHSGGYETSRGFTVGFYNETPLPCPDILFRNLPPAPETEDDLLAWYSLDPASRTAHIPISFGDAASWPDLPVGSPERRRMAQLLFGNYLQNGWSRNMTIFTASTLVRFVVYRDFVKVREWKLHEPPQGSSPDEARARTLYQGLMLQIAEFFQSLPEHIRTANIAGDGNALRALAVQHWGPDFSFGICTPIVHWHGLAISLYSPRDLLATVGSSPSREDGEWTKSDSFVSAFSHASLSVRIMNLATPGSPVTLVDIGDCFQPTQSRSICPDSPQRSESGQSSATEDTELKWLNPLWPANVLRIAMIHVYCFRYLQNTIDGGSTDERCAGEGQGPSPEVTSALLHDINDCIDSIAKTQTKGFLEKYTQLVQKVIGKLLLGIDVTQDEAEAVRLLRKADHVI